VSTQLRQAAKNFDEIISSRDADFALSGLKEESLIRLSFLVAIPRNKIAGSIGSISSHRRSRLLQRLSDHLVK
jgi:mRNA interferase MazF